MLMLMPSPIRCSIAGRPSGVAGTFTIKFLRLTSFQSRSAAGPLVQGGQALLGEVRRDQLHFVAAVLDDVIGVRVDEGEEVGVAEVDRAGPADGPVHPNLIRAGDNDHLPYTWSGLA